MHVEMIRFVLWSVFDVRVGASRTFYCPNFFFAWNGRNAVHGIHHSAELKRYHARHSGSAHPRLFGASVANSTHFQMLICHQKYKNCNFIGENDPKIHGLETLALILCMTTTYMQLAVYNCECARNRTFYKTKNQSIHRKQCQNGFRRGNTSFDTCSSQW